MARPKTSAASREAARETTVAAGEARDLIISFDTTGSMYPCLTQVRREVDRMIGRLFTEVPDIRIGVIAHGDYCDGDRVISRHDLSTNQRTLSEFVRTVPATSGGDAPEAYELVLHRARTFNWAEGRSKALVMIGDEVPHGPTERQNRDRLDWQVESRALGSEGVRIYGVQCLNRRHATSFYQGIASASSGYHLTLDQFSDVTQMLLAIGYQQASTDLLESYEQEIIGSHRMNRSLDRIFAALRGRAVSASMGSTDLQGVPPGRFQVLTVDEDMPIKNFCEDQGVEFRQGRGFYELTKTVTVQGTKEIVLMHRTTGDLFTGSRARELLGLPTVDEDVKLRPTHLETYIPFIQSTSNNRKLIGGTRLLYEVPDWDAS
jgi:hypothetical protein